MLVNSVTVTFSVKYLKIQNKRNFEHLANRQCSIYKYSNMVRRLSGQTSKFGVVV